ncbi:MBL fold metallo-hydrolase [Bacteriovorax sp. DB6_IX]|uniref:MBL fold metallo-hydrolase n=1 Tax=Bacteriovorax sp. DB6_IX TaxID=1353530 RepID=UPI000389E5EB|nr:MBL fold metallo-hydrolase [Bacteriovorax sp. DB6_IX]EQC52295.1 metallo-beta-lactamase domain protein [Bacteriovorax sp. DB6_IX]
MKDKLNITPLGGVGQIGSNCTLVQSEDENILIDCGILFPYEDFFDINYLIPDLREVEHKISKIIITHGHEDHIGAIHHYIEKFPEAEIYAPLFAKKLIENKLDYKSLSKKIKPLNNKIEFGAAAITPIHVNHSIPDTKGLMITHDKLDTAVLFISDFKVDLNSPYEAPINLDLIKVFFK